MDRGLSRSLPYLPRYHSVSPARSPRLDTRRVFSLRSVSQPSHRILYLDKGGPAKLINSYHVSHSPSPNRSYRHHLLTTAPSQRLTRASKSKSAQELNSTHVYTRYEELPVHAVLEGDAGRKANSCEDIYHKGPFFPDITTSESGVSVGESEEGSMFDPEEDLMSQHSFGSSSAFFELTIDSELDRCDSDSMSGAESGNPGDRTLNALYEGELNAHGGFRGNRTNRELPSPDSGSSSRCSNSPMSYGDSRRRELMASPSRDFEKIQSRFQALKVLIPGSETQGKAPKAPQRPSDKNILPSTPLAQSTPHVSPRGLSETRLSIKACWDVDDPDHELRNQIDKGKAARALFQSNVSDYDTKQSSRVDDDSSCNSSFSEDNYSDISNATLHSPVVKKTRLVKKPSDVPASARLHNRGQRDAFCSGLPTETAQRSKLNYLETADDNRCREHDINNANDSLPNKEKAAGHGGDEDSWWAEYNTGMTETETDHGKVLSGTHRDGVNSTSLSCVSGNIRLFKPVKVNIPLINAGKHGQEKLKRLSQTSPPPRDESPSSSPASPSSRESPQLAPGKDEQIETRENWGTDQANMATGTSTGHQGHAAEHEMREVIEFDQPQSQKQSGRDEGEDNKQSARSVNPLYALACVHYVPSEDDTPFENGRCVSGSTQGEYQELDQEINETNNCEKIFFINGKGTQPNNDGRIDSNVGIGGYLPSLSSSSADPFTAREADDRRGGIDSACERNSSMADVTSLGKDVTAASASPPTSDVEDKDNVNGERINVWSGQRAIDDGQRLESLLKTCDGNANDRAETNSGPHELGNNTRMREEKEEEEEEVGLAEKARGEERCSGGGAVFSTRTGLPAENTQVDPERGRVGNTSSEPFSKISQSDCRRRQTPGKRETEDFSFGTEHEKCGDVNNEHVFEENAHPETVKKFSFIRESGTKDIDEGHVQAESESQDSTFIEILSELKPKSEDNAIQGKYSEIISDSATVNGCDSSIPRVYAFPDSSARLEHEDINPTLTDLNHDGALVAEEEKGNSDNQLKEPRHNQHECLLQEQEQEQQQQQVTLSSSEDCESEAGKAEGTTTTTTTTDMEGEWIDGNPALTARHQSLAATREIPQTFVRVIATAQKVDSDRGNSSNSDNLSSPPSAFSRPLPQNAQQSSYTFTPVASFHPVNTPRETETHFVQGQSSTLFDTSYGSLFTRVPDFDTSPTAGNQDRESCGQLEGVGSDFTTQIFPDPSSSSSPSHHHQESINQLRGSVRGEDKGIHPRGNKWSAGSAQKRGDGEGAEQGLINSVERGESFLQPDSLPRERVNIAEISTSKRVKHIRRTTTIEKTVTTERKLVDILASGLCPSECGGHGSERGVDVVTDRSTTETIIEQDDDYLTTTTTTSTTTSPSVINNDRKNIVCSDSDICDSSTDARVTGLFPSRNDVTVVASSLSSPPPGVERGDLEVRGDDDPVLHVGPSPLSSAFVALSRLGEVNIKSCLSPSRPTNSALDTSSSVVTAGLEKSPANTNCWGGGGGNNFVPRPGSLGPNDHAPSVGESAERCWVPSPHTSPVVMDSPTTALLLGKEEEELSPSSVMHHEDNVLDNLQAQLQQLSVDLSALRLETTGTTTTTNGGLASFPTNIAFHDHAEATSVLKQIVRGDVEDFSHFSGRSRPKPSDLGDYSQESCEYSDSNSNSGRLFRNPGELTQSVAVIGGGEVELQREEYDNGYDFVTTDLRNSSSHHHSRHHHLPLLKPGHQKASSLWTLQEETESVLDALSPKHSPRRLTPNAPTVAEGTRAQSVPLVQQSSDITGQVPSSENEDKISRPLSSGPLAHQHDLRAGIAYEESSSDFEGSEGNYSSISTIESASCRSSSYSREQTPLSDADSAHHLLRVGTDKMDYMEISELSPVSDADRISSFHDFVSGLESGRGSTDLAYTSGVSASNSCSNQRIDRPAHTGHVSTAGPTTFKSSVAFCVSAGEVERSVSSAYATSASSALDKLSASLEQFNTAEMGEEDMNDSLFLTSDMPGNCPRGSSSSTLHGRHDEVSSEASLRLHVLDLDLSRISSCPSPTPSDLSESSSTFTCTGTAQIKKAFLSNDYDIPVPTSTPKDELKIASTKKPAAKVDNDDVVCEVREQRIKQFEQLLNEFDRQTCGCATEGLADLVLMEETRTDDDGGVGGSVVDATSTPAPGSSGDLDNLYTAFTRDDAEKKQNHTCVVVEDENMSTFRFRRFLKKSHTKRKKGRKVLRFLSRLNCVSESVHSPEMSSRRKHMLFSGDSAAPQHSFSTESMDSPSPKHMRISNPVLISSTSFQHHPEFISPFSSPQKSSPSTSNQSLDSFHSRTDSAYSSISESAPPLGSPEFSLEQRQRRAFTSSSAYGSSSSPRPTLLSSTSGGGGSVSSSISVFGHPSTSGIDHSFSDSAYYSASSEGTIVTIATSNNNNSNNSNTSFRHSSFVSDDTTLQAMDSDMLTALTDVFEQLDVCEGEIDTALLNRLRHGHTRADIQ